MDYEKKEVPWGKIILFALGVGTGILIYELEHFGLLSYQQEGVALAVAFVSFFLSVLIHELGHLVTGLCAGYRFSSYRIGCFALCRLPYPEDEEEKEEAEETAESGEKLASETAVPLEQGLAEPLLPETPLPEPISAESAAAVAQTQLEFGVPEMLDDHSEESYAQMMEEEVEEEEEEEEDYIDSKEYYFIWRKYKLPGTVGQCLMVPPPFKNPHNVPYQAYLLGGGIANLVSIPFACIALLLFPSFWWVVAIFSAMSLLSAVSNLIPMKMGGLPNDGYQIKLCKQDPHSHAAMVYQLRIAAASAEGISTGDMPEEWFYAKFPLDQRMTTNPLVANLWFYTGDRFFVHGELFQAKIIYESIANAKGLMPLLRQQAVYAYLLTLISEGRVEQAKLYPIPKAMAKKAKSMEKYHPLYSSFSYAYGKLVSESGKRMKESMIKFEKVAYTYPYDGEIEDFRQIMARLDDVVLQR